MHVTMANGCCLEYAKLYYNLTLALDLIYCSSVIHACSGSVFFVYFVDGWVHGYT